MSKRYSHIAAAVLARPWALLPSTLAIMGEVIRLRLAETPLSEDEIRERVALQAQSYGDRLGAQRVGGVAVIPVYGVITQRASMMSEYSGGTSLELLQAALREALADDDVKAVALDVDSPGGSVDGLPEFAAELRASAAGPKPIVAVANTMAASAAYWAMSGATELVVTPSGSVGSIGVYALHEDHSREIDAAGVTPTFVSAGPFKTEGNPYEPLSAEARAHLQEEVDHFYSLFLSDVARGRRTDRAALEERFGGGRMVLPQAALAAGMVDRVDTLEATVRRLARGRGIVSRGRAAAEPLLEVAFDFNEAGEILARPVRRHETGTSDDSWDGPANEARLPSPMTVATAEDAYAWLDEERIEDGEIVKDACKFIHHEVGENGRPGAANLQACSSGRAVLHGGRGGTTIPEADKPGVWEHLAGHERDAGRDVPSWDEAMREAPPVGAIDPAEGPRALPSQRDQIAASAADFRRGIRRGPTPWYRERRS